MWATECLLLSSSFCYTIGFIQHFSHFIFSLCINNITICEIVLHSNTMKQNLYFTCATRYFHNIQSVNFEIIYNCLQIACTIYTFSQHTKHITTYGFVVRYLAFGFNSSNFVQHLNGYIISVEHIIFFWVCVVVVAVGSFFYAFSNLCFPLF